MKIVPLNAILGLTCNGDHEYDCCWLFGFYGLEGSLTTFEEHNPFNNNLDFSTKEDIAICNAAMALDSTLERIDSIVMAKKYIIMSRH